ncbi:response regulator [Sphingobacterium paludis]|uniref:Response regulator receiver domain-containing protein n=1 Tax=Sphingobacterium paludis TaxID=1476465 RepID=A0A4R7CQP3_9SPHI|nr:response regulator [Sphingobacterium paludis]TDS07484.1 response regulator receiver domain-containing protein [Sphingobacterium paludis]
MKINISNEEMKDLVLIIDDDPRNIFALRLALKSRGYRTVDASSVKEGLSLIEQNENIRVVLMDMMMPEIDGYEAIRLLHQDNRYADLPVIAVTAQAMTGDREKCLQAGAKEYIAKPVDIDKLIAILEKVR